MGLVPGCTDGGGRLVPVEGVPVEGVVVGVVVEPVLPDTDGFASVMSPLTASPSTSCTNGSRASKRLNAISSPSSTGGGRSVSDSVWVADTATALGSVAAGVAPVSADPVVASVAGAVPTAGAGCVSSAVVAGSAAAVGGASSPRT